MAQVSVLMPVYNGEAYLREAVDSILAQTYRDFEFIIIDDGSTDGTRAILAHYEQLDDRIQVHHQDNHGIAVTLNRGLQLATGAYIARMDADDVSWPKRLAEQVSYLDSHPEIGLVGTSFYLIDSTGATQGGPILTGPQSGALVEWALYWGNPIVHPSVMFRAAIAARCGGYSERYAYYLEDYDLWLRMLHDTSLAVLDHPLLNLRKHGLNVTVVKLNEHLDEVTGAVQAALAARVGYEPPARCVRLLWRLPLNGQASPAEVRQAVALLLDAFHFLAARYHLETEHLRKIRSDLAERLLRLVELYGDQSRFDALATFGHVLTLAPRLMLSSARAKAVLRVLLGSRRWNTLRHMRGRLVTHRAQGSEIGNR